MTARNAKGQFVSREEAAADLLLERAVAEAVALYRATFSALPIKESPASRFVIADTRAGVTNILRHAAEAESLLIDRRPAA